ncbi:CYFA0S01e16600g1_1 [Cyberlindnera fabianii]|uniref:Small ribosomal subunit protein uS9m n=1 Tax=Cyberlindnera fabianii TaxID=36022 RepID=A0A061AKU1_CYBFA|nr:hypothetical protein BON22_1643 [Cyberlindnera fabianii]CDR37761.1 CYFA0S01e16600g1_1 [Cyberlindnera fabianii]
MFRRSLGALTPLTRTASITPVRAQSTLTKLGASTPVSNPELEIKRIVPAHKTFYTPNAEHNNNLNELKALERKYTDLPRVSNVQGKWLSLQQYEPIGGGERLKASQHQELIKILNRLNAIDPQLRPAEVDELLTKYSRSSTINESGKTLQLLDQFGRSKTVSGRKSSTAVVYLVKGQGEILVNNKSINQHFPELTHRQEILYPLQVVEAEADYNIFAIVHGGGPTGQAGAIAGAIAKGLVVHNPLLKPRLYKAGCMTRDHRRVERKKPGKVKSRKSPTWVKR